MQEKATWGETLKMILRSMAFQVLLLLWGAVDAFMVAAYFYGVIESEWSITAPTLLVLGASLVVVDIILVPIWFFASCLNDSMDPYISVWAPKEDWE